MLPDKLKAGGQIFAIEYKDYIEPGKRGRVNYTHTLIEIKSDCDIQYQAETIIHEALHIAEERAGLKMDETFIQTFGRMWFCVLRDNPSLFSQDKIRICGFDYTVTQVDVVDKDSQQDLASWTRNYLCKMLMFKGLSDDAKEKHLMYMIFNALEAVLDVDIEQETAERICNWLHAILKDNPQIWPHNVIGEEF